jgi:hypothetical protein
VLLDNGNLFIRTKPPEDAGGIEKLGGSCAAIQELDWDGNLVWEYRNDMLHHDMERMPNGNTLILLWESLPEGMTEMVKGGQKAEDDFENMLGELVQEITPDGKVVYEWRSCDVLSVDEDVICPLENRKEWTHANSIKVNDEGDILISLRLIDDVAIIDRATGKFKWKWGKGRLSHQHHPTFLENGNVLIFDNGSHRVHAASHSEVLEVDPNTSEVAWSYKGDPPVSFFSGHISSADRLPNGNTLICEGASGRLFEVTQECKVVWEFNNPCFAMSRDSLSNATYRAHRYGLDHPAFRGRDMNPDNYAELNRMVASGLAISEGQPETSES